MAREEQEIRYPDYPLFKGLQKPLEFMGIQGRYIYWAAATAGGAIMVPAYPDDGHTRLRSPIRFDGECDTVPLRGKPHGMERLC